ncbi:MAG: flagellin [Spirochaetaceae bacterium]|nr:flagellin [Spirochaetaceae bacterium]MCF7938860.1 flagellin [Spirochaetales bacterium]
MNLLKLFLVLVFGWVLAVQVSAGGIGTYVFVPHNSNLMIASGSAGSVALTHNSQTYDRIQTHIRRLSSAQRITRAADDPAGLAVAEKMNASLRQLKREVMNAHDYRNFLNYKEAVIAENIGHIQRLRELAMRAAGGIFSTSDRQLLQAEVEQLLRQIDMNAKSSSFNKKTVVPGLTVEALGLNGFTVVVAPASKIGRLDEVHRRLIDLRTRSGLQSSTLQLEIDGKQHYMLNLQDSESKIRDLDMAEALLDFSKDMVLYQTQTGLILHSR